MYAEKLRHRLQAIFLKMQKRAFIPAKQTLFFHSWVITDYCEAPIARFEIPIGEETLTFSAPPLQDQIQLKCLRNMASRDLTLFAFDSQKIKEIPQENLIHPLRRMSTPFAVLPWGLSKDQEKALSEFEFILKYSAGYIIRHSWGEKLCDLPRVDNRIKPVANAWGETMFRLFNLCVNCRDFLTKDEKKAILSSWDWLNLLVSDMRKAQIMYLKSEAAKVPSTKRSMIAEQRRFIDQLEDYQNPVESEFYPHFHRLMEVSMGVAEKADVFKKNFWKPYLSSLRELVATMDKNSFVIAIWYQNGARKRENRGRKIK